MSSPYNCSTALSDLTNGNHTITIEARCEGWNLYYPRTLYDNVENYSTYKTSSFFITDSSVTPTQPSPSLTPTLKPTSTLTPTPTESPAPTPSPIVTFTPTQVIVQSVPTWFYVIITGLVAVIAVLLGIIIMQKRNRETKPN